MKRGRAIKGLILLVVMICLAIGVFVSVYHPSEEGEPRFQGQTLRHWVGELRRPSATQLEKQLAQDAIEMMGTNVIPGILAAMARRDSAALLPLYKLGRRVGLVKKVPDTVRWSDDWYTRSLASHVTPEVRSHILDALFAAYAECYDDHESENGGKKNRNLRLAIKDFGGLSPDYLQSQLSITDQRKRAAGASLVGSVGKPSEELISTLGGLLEDDSHKVRFHALAALGTYRRLPPTRMNEVVAFLQLGLSDSKAHIRSFSAMMLSRYGKNAEGAVPRLIELERIERAKTTGVRDTSFLHALHSIDPRAVKELDESDSNADDNSRGE